MIRKNREMRLDRCVSDIDMTHGSQVTAAKLCNILIWKKQVIKANEWLRHYTKQWIVFSTVYPFQTRIALRH